MNGATVPFGAASVGGAASSRRPAGVTNGPRSMLGRDGAPASGGASAASGSCGGLPLGSGGKSGKRGLTCSASLGAVVFGADWARVPETTNASDAARRTETGVQLFMQEG